MIKSETIIPPLITDLNYKPFEFAHYAIVQDLQGDQIKLCIVRDDHCETHILRCDQAEQLAYHMLDIVKAKRERLQATS